MHNAIDTFMRRKDSSTDNRLGTDARTRALHALSRMRRQHFSLAEACQLEHIKPNTFLRQVGSAVRQDKRGSRYRAVAGDRFRRDLQIPTVLGPTSVPIYGSKNATGISNYLSAVALYLRKGDASKLKRFKGKTVGVRGQKLELITDPQTLSALALAGALQFDRLYTAFSATA